MFSPLLQLSWSIRNIIYPNLTDMEPAHQKVPTQLYRKLCGSYTTSTHDHQMRWNLLFYMKNNALYRHLSLVVSFTVCGEIMMVCKTKVLLCTVE